MEKKRFFWMYSMFIVIVMTLLFSFCGKGYEKEITERETFL